jgi:DNA-binding transcriptional LysR family regulator
VRLLHRTTRAIALTDEGRQFLESAQPALAALERALQGVRAAKDESIGPLRIVGPRSTFLPVLWPVVEEYSRLHPGVQPDVVLDDHIGNWVRDRVDVGFRFGIQPEEGVIARRLFPLQMIICASPAYLRQHGAPASLAELANHRCATFRHPVSGELMPWSVQVDDEIVRMNVSPALSTNDADLEVTSVISGQAIGLLTGTAAAPLIRSGQLVPILSQHACEYMSLFIYYGSRTAQPARVRAFIDLALERLLDSTMYVMSKEELSVAESKARAALHDNGT